MSNELRIIFEGIIVLGPPPPSSNYGPGPLFGVMPRITRHESRYSELAGKDPLYIPAHLPVVFTDLTPLPGSRKPDDEYRSGQVTFSIWYPMRERMRLRFSPSADPDDLRYVREEDNPPAPPAGPEPLHDIGEIADFREIWPDRGHLREGTLRRTPPVSDLVAGQIFVPSGRVGSGGEFKKIHAADATFLPPRTPSPVTKKLRPQVVVSVRTDRVDFDMYSLDTGERLDPLAFAIENPTLPSVIRIANGDPKNVRYVIEHLLTPAQASEPTGIKPNVPQVLGGTSQPAYGDIDFEMGYSVLAGDDDGGPLPIPWVPIAFGERNCNTGLAASPGTGAG